MKVTFPATVRKGVVCPHPAYAGKVAVSFARLKPEEEVTVTVESLRHPRTLSQNARLWKLLSVFEELGMAIDGGEALARAFVARGLKVCDEAEAHAARGLTKFGCLDLIAAILRDAGLMEEGR